MDPLRPGDPERIGDYTILGLLGQGPRGEVFLGQESEDGPVQAIKLLSPAPEATPEALAAALAAKRVSSSYVARVLDAGWLGTRLYIVREHVEGKSLAQLVADDGPLSGDQLERVAVGTLTALSAVHLAGISHCGLTPHNVIVGADGPRVTDVGIGNPVGEIGYQAPEQLNGLQYGPYADVFAWGAVVTFAGTGRPPFGHEPDALLNAEPEVDIQAEPMRRVVLSALAKDVGQRPTTYSALMQLLGDTRAPKPQAPAPADGAPLQGLAIQGLAVQGPPIEGVPVQGVPIQGVPIQGVPVQAPPLDGMPVHGASLPMQGPPVEGVPLQGPMPVPGVPIQGPPVQGPPMEGMPMQGMAVPPPEPTTQMWGPPPAEQQPQQLRLEAMPSRPGGNSSLPPRRFPMALVAVLAVVAVVAGVGLWGANKYVQLQQISPAAAEADNGGARKIPVPGSDSAPAVPQGSDPLGVDPSQTQPEVTVPWATSSAAGDPDVSALVLPTDWPSGAPTTPVIPELTTMPATPSGVPTQPVAVPNATQPVQQTATPTASGPIATATVTKTAEPSQTPTASPTPTQTETPTSTPAPTPTQDPTKDPAPTQEPEPTKTSAQPTPTPTKTTAKPTPTPAKTTAKPTPTPAKTTAKPTPTPAKTTAKPTPAPKNPFTAAQVCGPGFGVQRQGSFTGGTTYQLYNSSTGENCVVTIKSGADVGKPTPVSATLNVEGGAGKTDSGNYQWYAGPVKLAAKGKCVKYSGSAGSYSTTAGYANCG